MAFFQNTVTNKYLNSIDKLTIQKKFVQFKEHFHNPQIQQNIRNSKEEQYQEGFLRDLFVNILGYTLNPQNNFNLTTEYKNIKDSKKADGAIIIADKVQAVIELKGTDTTDLGKIETQAFGYKNNQPDCIYIITSNFEKIRFYIDNAIEHLEFNLFTLTEKEFELLYLCLAHENLEKGIAKKIKVESISQEDTITKKLYNDYSLFKRELHQNLVQLNSEFNELELFKKSQKLLDRFLFLFFAEDRQLLPPNSVRLILNDWRELQERDENVPLFNRFRKYFGYLNTGFKGKRYDVFAYNGGLFKPDNILDVVKIDDELLYKHTLKLSDYDFASDVDVNILGHIFENSLNELDEIKAQLEGQVIDKTKSKRKKDGVFYTPKYITKYIVENTVGKLCTEKKNELSINSIDFSKDYFLKTARQIEKQREIETNSGQKKIVIEKSKTFLSVEGFDNIERIEKYRKYLLNLTICDPACGSGAFLNQALDFLINEHNLLNEMQSKISKSSFIIPDIENAILENNIFGVDLNEESVEIAKLSLWLRTAQRERKLNDLNNNIKCGNSLIETPAIAGDKAFNWQQAFPQVFEKGGFDVVIGNPPYVDIKALPNEIVQTLFKNYATAENRINLYSIFIEKGVSILGNKGLLSYINPNSMLLNSSYQKLRNLISSGLIEIDKLPDDVFLDAKVETIMFFYRKDIIFESVDLILYDRQDKIQFIDETKKQSILKESWITENGYVYSIYSDNKYNSIIRKIENNIDFLENIADFSLGITPYDKYQGHSQEIIKNRAFHSATKIDEQYKPLITGENITRYLTLNHINEYIKYGSWLGAMREERFFTKPRIIIRQIVSGKPPRIYASFTDIDLYFTQIGFGIIPKDDVNVDVKYLLCIINSFLMNLYHKYKFLDIEKDLFQKILIANCKKFPIKKISIETQQPFIEKADLILSLNKELQEASQKFQRAIQRKFEIEDLPTKLQNWYTLTFKEFITELSKKKIKLTLAQESEWEDYFLQEQTKAQVIKNQIDATDKEIDQMVYELYELTEEEIKIVEGN